MPLLLRGMDSKEVKIRGISEKEGIKVNMDKMEVTPMSFIVLLQSRRI